MSERINLNLKTEEYLRRSQMLQFVEKSRKENPDPDILIKRRQQLQHSPRFTPQYIETKIMIDEVIIRLSASSESGVGTFEVYELIHSDEEHRINNAAIQHEIWSLVDTGILTFNPDRRLILSPDIHL